MHSSVLLRKITQKVDLGNNFDLLLQVNNLTCWFICKYLVILKFVSNANYI